MSETDPLVLTGDGRQIRQSRYYIEQQMAEQSAKLNSLLASPLAAGVYGATGNETATGITAGLEGVAQGAGFLGAGARGGVPSRYQRAPETYLQQNQPRPKIGRTPPKQFYDDNVINFQTGPQKRAKELLDAIDKAEASLQDPNGPMQSNDWSTGAPRGNAYTETEELQRNKDLKAGKPRTWSETEKILDEGADRFHLIDEMTLRGLRKNHPEETAELERRAKARHPERFEMNPLKDVMGPAANDDKGKGYAGPDSPYGYSWQAKAQQEVIKRDSMGRPYWMRDMNYEGHPDTGEIPYRDVPTHNTTAEGLVSSGTWAKPMPPVSPLHPYEPFEQRLRSEARVKGLPPVDESYLDTNFDRLREFLNPKDKPKK